jgi:hypothetical protein
MGFFQNIFAPKQEFTAVDNRNRFNFILQKMMNTRWYVTVVTLVIFLTIVIGLGVGIITKSTIDPEWKELLLLLLGAFIGSYNRVIDFWFNNAERDNLLIEKVDDEDDEVKVVGDGDGGYSVEVKK